MNTKFYTNRNGEISKEDAPTDFVEEMMSEVSGIALSKDVVLEKYQNIDSKVDYERGVQESYSIKLGAFIEWDDDITLEATFDSFEDILSDMRGFCFEELQDFEYAPYIEVEEELL